MNETHEHEIRALKDLAQCEGWQILVAAIRQQWQGEPFVAKIRGAVTGKVSAEGATESVRELLAQRAAIEAVTLWPEQRRKKLETEVTAAEAGQPEGARRA